MLIVEMIDVDFEGNEIIWFGGKVVEFFCLFLYNNDVFLKFV